jgi:endonuclease/exonuclease/phosphatase family metal-dependent hydrolase
MQITHSNVLKGSIPLRIITHNIRYATKTPVLGEQPWTVRGPKLTRQLIFNTEGHDSPFICLQEVLHSQVQYIQAQLGDGWSHIGRGRDEKPTDGEFSPVFFRSDTWECVKYDTKWLSKTPEKPSRGWDAVLNRIVTMGLFRHKETGLTVIVMSTHVSGHLPRPNVMSRDGQTEACTNVILQFDHRGTKARENSAKLLIQFAKEWNQDSNSDSPPPSAVLIGGDFNSDPSDGAYKMMTAKGSGMSDIADLLPEEEHYGNYLTYTSFGEPGEAPSRIDFLFIKEPRSATVKTFGVLANSFDDNIRLSDHRAVVADLSIPL